MLMNTLKNNNLPQFLTVLCSDVLAEPYKGKNHYKYPLCWTTLSDCRVTAKTQQTRKITRLFAAELHNS